MRSLIQCNEAGNIKCSWNKLRRQICSIKRRNLSSHCLRHSSCPVHVVVFAVKFNDNACKLCTVTPITDTDFLQIFQDEKNKEERKNEQEVGIQSEKDNHGHEHVL